MITNKCAETQIHWFHCSGSLIEHIRSTVHLSLFKTFVLVTLAVFIWGRFASYMYRLHVYDVTRSVIAREETCSGAQNHEQREKVMNHSWHQAALVLNHVCSDVWIRCMFTGCFLTVLCRANMDHPEHIYIYIKKWDESPFSYLKDTVNYHVCHKTSQQVASIQTNARYFLENTFLSIFCSWPFP